MQMDTIRRGKKNNREGETARRRVRRSGRDGGRTQELCHGQETGNCRNFFFCSSHSPNRPLVHLPFGGGGPLGPGLFGMMEGKPTALHPQSTANTADTADTADTATNHIPRWRPGCQGLSPSQKAVRIHFMESSPIAHAETAGPEASELRGDDTCEKARNCNGQGSMHEQASLSWAETSHRGHHVRFHNNLLLTQSGPILPQGVREPSRGRQTGWNWPSALCAMCGARISSETDYPPRLPSSLGPCVCQKGIPTRAH